MARLGGGGGGRGGRGGGGRGRGGSRGGRGQGRRGGGNSPGGRRGGKNVGGKSGGGGKGPRLGHSLLRAIGVNEDRRSDGSDDSDKEIAGDVYEYEEEEAPEERGKNKRFDEIDKMEYELPSDFEDEEIDEDEADGAGDKEEGDDEELPTAKAPKRKLTEEIDLNSDEDDEGSEEEDEGEEEEEMSGGKGGEINFDSSEDEDEEEEEDEDEDDHEVDDERHQRLIEAVTGRPSKQDREERSRKDHVITEAYPESEFNLNPSGANGSGNAPITVEDLMNPLHDAAGFGTLRKRMQELQNRGAPVQAPLPKVVQDRVDRQAGYKQTSRDISGWQNLVKRNREAPTLVFNKREEVPAITTASLASTFKATTDFEKEINSLLNKSKLMAPKGVEEAEMLELNKLTVEEVRERQERLAKMRNLLFRHELKAKRVKKIKSKTFHKLKKKGERSKAEHDMALAEADPEAAKEAAIKQEFLRAEERMTLKHKNQSRWAKRILKRGLKGQENDGTRDAIADQLQKHALLTRKIHSATLSGSDDSSSSDGEDDDEPTGLVLGKPDSSALAKAKVATLKALEEGEDDAVPKTGLFAIPFMARAIEKKKKAAEMEAMAVLDQLEQAEADGDILALHDDYSRLENAAKRETTLGGRIAFGDAKRPTENEKKPPKQVDELSDVDDSDDELMERSAGGRVDMGETALDVSNKWVKTDVSSAKQADDYAGAPFGLDFLANLGPRAFSTGVEDVAVPAKPVDVDLGIVPAESSKSKVFSEPLTANGNTTSALEETTAVPTGLDASNTNTETLATNVAATLAGKRKERAEKKSNGESSTSNGSSVSNGTLSEMKQAEEVVAGQAGKRRKKQSKDGRSVVPSLNNVTFTSNEKTQSKDGGNVVSLPNNGTSTSDKNVETLATVTDGGSAGKRKKKKQKMRTNAVSVTTNGHQDSSAVEKIVVGFAGRPKQTVTANGHSEPSRGETKVERKGEPLSEAMNTGTEEAVVAAAAAAPTSFSDDDSDQETGLPTDSMSQQALIRQAFAGDDVEAEFEQLKAQALDVEVPQGEAPVTLPGWGQWSHVQEKKGQPAWILKEQEKLQKARNDALAKRKDAKLKHVVISEKMDKKASKFCTADLPFPFKSREVYERSMRMPIGREYNTDKAYRNMIRPAVIKSAGQIIDPIKREQPTVKEQAAAACEPRRKHGKK